jgi:hypothetical protein
MRSFGRVSVVLVAAAATGLVALTPSSAAGPGHGHGDWDQDRDRDRGRSTTLEFDANLRPFDQNFVDVGSPGPGIGDLLVFQDDLLAEGAQVGVQGGTCTVTAVLAEGFQTHCVGAVQLPDGQIAFSGLATEDPVKELAVVGGTDRYRRAGGSYTFVENGDGTGSVTIELVRGR